MSLGCFLAAVIGLSLQLSEVHAMQPPPEKIAVKVKYLWEENSLSQLKTYLEGLEGSHRNFVPAIVAEAFHDSVFCGRLNRAKNKLLVLKVAAESNPQGYSNDYKIALTASLRSITDEIRIHTARGVGEQALHAEANPQAVRNAWEEHLLPILDLLYASPEIFVTNN